MHSACMQVSLTHQFFISVMNWRVIGRNLKKESIYNLRNNVSLIINVVKRKNNSNTLRTSDSTGLVYLYAMSHMGVNLAPSLF